MNYYEVSFLKSPLNPLTYESLEEIKIGTKVLVPLGNRKKQTPAVVIKKVPKPEFKCVEILEILPFYYDEKMFEIAKFISQYYVCSLGEALSVYVPFDEKIQEEENKIEFDSKICLSKEQEKAYNFCQEKKTSLTFCKYRKWKNRNLY